jgi:hypothetical protein
MKAVDYHAVGDLVAYALTAFQALKSGFVIRLSEPVKVKLTGGYCPCRSYYIFCSVAAF